VTSRRIPAFSYRGRTATALGREGEEAGVSCISVRV
jgi:hypothetical protein